MAAMSPEMRWVSFWAAKGVAKQVLESPRWIRSLRVIFWALTLSIFFRLLVAHRPKDREDLDDSQFAASIALTIAGGVNAVLLRNKHRLFIKLLVTTKRFCFNLLENGVRMKLES